MHNYKTNKITTCGSDKRGSGPEVIHFSCSAHLRLKFILLINVKMPTISFISRINYMLSGFIPKNLVYLGYFRIYEEFKFHAQLR